MLSDVDVAIIPGLVFDKKGGRIGYGGGFYDKLLDKNDNTITVGVCHSSQLIETVPMEQHDIKLKKIFTEFDDN